MAVPLGISGDNLYAPLNPATSDDAATSEVRFLELLPGEFDQPIRCSLRACVLKNHPKYEALSYVWGDARVTKPVYVNGHLMQVTSNLATALQYLRHRQRPRTLWVDAICINQADTPEKGHQLPLMGLIYSQCSQTVAWLGLPTPEMMPVISLMSPYLSERYWREKTLKLYRNVMAWTSTNNRMRRNIYYRKLGLATILVSKFPYWTRIWTYQEFWLPKKTVFVCGTLAFEPLLRSKRWDAQTIIRNAYFNPEIPKNVDLSLSEEWNRLESVMEEHVVTGLQYGFMLELYSDGKRPSPEKAFTLTLLQTTGRQCTNVHDRIYGLYAFTPQLQEMYPVDCSKPACVVMYQTTAASIQLSGMILYTGFSLHSPEPIGVSIPSWTLDFNKPFDFPTKVPILIVPDASEPGHYSPKPKAPTVTRVALALPAHNMGTCSSQLRLSRDRTALAGELLRLLEKEDEFHMRIRLALASFIDMEPITRNPLLLQDLLQYHSQPLLQRGEIGYDWKISPGFFEKTILKPLAGKTVALFDAVALSDEDQGAPSIACIVSGSASEGDVLILPTCDGPVMALRRDVQPWVDEAGGGVYFTMVGVVWVEGMSGTRAADMEENGKRLVDATRRTGYEDFVIR
ncbi:HET-domain-containing protein [Apiospora rasikravindrae]|uniref:HET-domain-containing protein n=1 Tax=Apiospora rasikravindrae TaxID=990691 RepID=A0ABR1TC05_9PEZI